MTSSSGAILEDLADADDGEQRHERDHRVVDERDVAHLIGIGPTNIVATVMNFGRSRFAAR